ncbi:MAG: PQQ-binding-like beta-propeller repeat protein, partial [Chloroflexi bacterium]|nr:PQQ-binding-like beta-propeller repeat protein [Chloroflexota bacterium]
MHTQQPKTVPVRESGQSLVFMAFLFVALLGFLVLVTDVGYMYYTKRDLQGIVDAATMAGARMTPTSVDTSTEKWEAVQNTTHEALACYARNIGLSANSVPSTFSASDFAPNWNGGTGTNYKYSTTVGGDQVSVTVFYQDAITQAQDVAKELCVRVDVMRNTPMFFAGAIGFQDTDIAASAAGFRGIFKVTWTFRNYGQDVHATPFYYVDPHAGNREVVYIGCRDGYIYCLDALGFQDGSKKTWAYWRFRPANNGTGTTSGYTLESTSTAEKDAWPMIQGQVRVVDRGGQTRIYFTTVPGGTNKGYLYCLDGSTGQRIWSQNIQAPGYHAGVYGMSYVDSRPNLSSNNEVVYVGSRAGYLYAFNSDTGAPVDTAAWDNYGADGRVELYGG